MSPADEPENGPPAPEPEVLLTRAEASAELARHGIRMKPQTLARAWSTGAPPGPPCRHVRGRPLYPKALLQAWAEAQITELASSARERDLQKRKRPRDPD